MPAKLTRPTINRIIRLREDEGLRAADIVCKFDLSPGTVSKYVNEHEADREVSLSPAARLSEADVGILQQLVARESRVVGG